MIRSGFRQNCVGVRLEFVSQRHSKEVCGGESTGCLASARWYVCVRMLVREQAREQARERETERESEIERDREREREKKRGRKRERER